VRAALTVDVATLVSLQCSHQALMPSAMIATQTVLQALHVGAAQQL